LLKFTGTLESKITFFYRPGARDLEMPALREAIRKLYLRLFPEEVPAVVSEQNEGPEDSEDPDDCDDPPAPPEHIQQPRAKMLDYKQQLSKLFDDALLNSLGAQPQVNTVFQCYFRI
jgi:hypothetical protein